MPIFHKKQTKFSLYQPRVLFILSADKGAVEPYAFEVSEEGITETPRILTYVASALAFVGGLVCSGDYREWVELVVSASASVDALTHCANLAAHKPICVFFFWVAGMGVSSDGCTRFHAGEISWRVTVLLRPPSPMLGVRMRMRASHAFFFFFIPCRLPKGSCPGPGKEVRRSMPWGRPRFLPSREGAR